MEHDLKLKELEKKHEYLMSKGTEYRKNMLTFGGLAIAVLVILLLFIFILSNIGLKENIIPSLQFLLSIGGFTFGAFQYGKRKKDEKKII